MKASETTLPGVYLIEPRVFPDQRGFFQEIWQATRYAKVHIPGPFVQDNRFRVVLENNHGHLTPLSAQEQSLLRSSLQKEVLASCPWVAPGEPEPTDSQSVRPSA